MVIVVAAVDAPKLQVIGEAFVVLVSDPCEGDSGSSVWSEETNGDDNLAGVVYHSTTYIREGQAVTCGPMMYTTISSGLVLGLNHPLGMPW